jgi:putative tryptophan/tyrosine transport system ATP-binding protein
MIDVLTLKDITLTYPTGATPVVALRGVSLRIESGEFVTVVGSNGAGKSSLIKVISGAERPGHGEVEIGGCDVTRQAEYRRAARIARVFDDPQAGTLPDLSIEDNMALAMSRGTRRRLRLAINGKRRQLMRERLAVLGLGLEDRLGDSVGLLSAGQRQSLTMVMAALRAPEVLLLDEHLAALDPGTQARTLELSVSLARGLSAATVMVTHNMQHAIEVGDRLLVMSRGRVIFDIAGAEKRAMTVDGLVDRITSSGGTVSDRSLLRDEAIGERLP